MPTTDENLLVAIGELRGELRTIPSQLSSLANQISRTEAKLDDFARKADVAELSNRIGRLREEDAIRNRDVLTELKVVKKRIDDIERWRIKVVAQATAIASFVTAAINFAFGWFK